MKRLKVLNLYAGIGGNRKLWEDVERNKMKSKLSYSRRYDYTVEILETKSGELLGGIFFYKRVFKLDGSIEFMYYNEMSGMRTAQAEELCRSQFNYSLTALKKKYWRLLARANRKLGRLPNLDLIPKNLLIKHLQP